METTEHTIQDTQTIKNVESKLTERKAINVSDESYTAEAESGEIIAIRTEDTSKNTFVEFDIVLTNEKVGTISFREYEFDNGEVEKFLNNIDCTVQDLTQALHQSVPVTYTELKGWVLFYGFEKHLETTYEGESNWYTIDSESGYPKPNNKYSLVLNTPLFVGFLLSIGLWKITPIFFGFLLTAVLWYVNCMIVGMSMPSQKSITDE